MLSINGLHLKNVVEFRGHDGEPLIQGDLYLEYHKLGFWSQDSWGGPDIIHLDSGYEIDKLNNRIAASNPDKKLCSTASAHPFEIDYDLELLMGDYILLQRDYEEYLKALRSGYYGVLIASDGYHMMTWHLPKAYVKQSDEVLMKNMEFEINKARTSIFFPENAYTKHTIKIYRSAKDFEIGEVIQAEDIRQTKDIDQLIKDSSEKLNCVKADVKTMLPDEKNR